MKVNHVFRGIMVPTVKEILYKVTLSILFGLIGFYFSYNNVSLWGLHSCSIAGVTLPFTHSIELGVEKR